MIVIAKVKSVSKHSASAADEKSNPYGLSDQELYFQCQISQLEHIVGFDGEDYEFTDYVCNK
jgi:hypothetical protein